MAELRDGTTLGATRRDGGWELTVDGTVVGRVREDRVELNDLDARKEPAGEKYVLRTSAGTPVVRLDAAGRKATWLTLSGSRHRLARQRPVPLRHRWVLRRDVVGTTVLSLTHTPLGARLTIEDTTGLHPSEVDALAAATILATIA